VQPTQASPIRLCSSLRVQNPIGLLDCSKAFRWFTRSTSAVFRRAARRLSTGLMGPLAFQQVAFASWTFLCPLQGWTSLTVGLLAEPDCNGVATFYASEKRGGWVLLYSGVVVSALAE
jgi:hypothetical protein